MHSRSFRARTFTVNMGSCNETPLQSPDLQFKLKVRLLSGPPRSVETTILLNFYLQ